MCNEEMLMGVDDDGDEGHESRAEEGVEVARAVEDDETEKSEDDTIEEARRPRVQCHPNKPSKKEIEEHRVTHWPFRSWCRHCVRGRAVSSPHRRKTAEAEEFSRDRIPTISFDHCFMGEGRQCGQ